MLVYTCQNLILNVHSKKFRNYNKFSIANEIELKLRDTNFFYYSVERKKHDENIHNNMQPSKQKEQ